MRQPSRLPVFVAVALSAWLSGCGKKGPPLPPLVRIPSPPVDFVAERRGLGVDVRFTLPASNSDSSRPANIQRVEVYALNGAEKLTENDVLKAGLRVGVVDVKAPRNLNDTVDADGPDSDVEALEGPGLDQGATAHVREILPGVPVANETTRTYVGVSITTRGRRGSVSTPVAVSLSPAPGAPAQPTVGYDETAISVEWPPLSAHENAQVVYHVYDVTSPDSAGTLAVAAGPAESRLSEMPLADTQYRDARVEWNRERCYAVRAVLTYGGLPVEGEASERRCVVLKDTFPPAPPTGVTAVASENAINLIWTPSPERDIAGYRVLRTIPPSSALTEVTSSTITESTFTDTVTPGVRYVYAVQAIDTAGNASEPSARVEETAR